MEPEQLTQVDNSTSYQQHPSVVGMKIEVDDLLDELELHLRGLAWDKERKKFIQIVEHPIMNKEGVSHFMSVARLFFSKMTLLSNLDEKLILKFCVNFEENIAELLFSKYELYDIDLDQWYTIVDMFGNTYTCILYRALEGFEQKYISNTMRSVESHNYSGQGSGGNTSWTKSLFKK